MADKTVNRTVRLYIDGKQVENSAKALQSELRKLKAEQANMTIGTQEYIEKGKQIRQVDKILSEHRKQWKDTGDAVKGADSNISTMTDSLGELSSAIPVGGFNSFASSIINLGKSTEGILPKIKALGTTFLSLLTNPAFLAIGGVAAAGAAFKWWYDYNLGLAEATRLTKEFTGLTGDELVSVRNEIQATADAMGTDYKDTLSTVDALMSQYGITAQEATKVIEDGFASGANLSGDMLSKLQQYAPTFHDAGISARQMTAIISQTRSGIFSDKGLDVITMASKRIREMGTATKDALDGIGINSKEIQKGLAEGTINTFDVIQQVSTKMKGFGADSEQVGAVLKDVFGKQGAGAGIKLIEQLDTMSTDLDKVKEQTGEWGNAQSELIQVNTELNGVMSALFDVSDNGFEEMIDQAKIFGTRILVDVMKGLMKVINYFIDLYNNSMLVRGAIQVVGLQFKFLWEAVKLVFNQIVDGVKGVGRNLKGLAEILEGIVTFSAEKVKKGWDDLIGGIGRTFSESINDYKNFGVNAAEAVYQSFKDTINNKPIEHLKIQAGIAGEASAETTTTGGNGGGGTSTDKKKKGKGKKGKSAEELERERIQQELKAIDLHYQAERLKLTELYNQGEIENKEEFDNLILDMEKKKISDELSIIGLSDEQKLQFEQKLQDNIKAYKDKCREEDLQAEKEYREEVEKNDKKRNDEVEKKWKQHRERLQAIADEMYNGIYSTITQTMGNAGRAIGEFIQGDKKAFHDFLKNLVVDMIDAVERIVIAATAANVGKDVMTEGWAGIATAAAKNAVIIGAFEAAKGLANSFDTGGFTADGAWNQPQGIVHSNEFVSNRFATQNPQVRPVLDLIDMAQKSGSAQNLTAEDIVGVYSGRTGMSIGADGNSQMMALISKNIVAISALQEQMKQPIWARTYATGKGGVNEAQELVERMNKNVAR